MVPWPSCLEIQYRKGFWYPIMPKALSVLMIRDQCFSDIAFWSTVWSTFTEDSPSFLSSHRVNQSIAFFRLSYVGDR
jgi:hypothetical protein